MYNYFRNLFFLVFLSLFTSVILAQNDTLPTKHIREITVSSLAKSNISLPYITIEREQILKNDYVSSADVLKNETGISIAKDGAWATSVNIRGLSEQRLLFSVDNDRIMTATDVAGVLSTVNLNSLEKIEVIKGAASVLYGNGAMGGVVNFVSYRPQYSETLQSNGKFNTGYQNVNNLFANSVNVNVTNSDWYLSLNGSYRTAGNTLTPAGILSNSQLNDASWGVTGGMKYRSNQELLVSYNHFQAWNTGIPGGTAFPAASVVSYKNFARNQLSGEYIFTDLTESLEKLSLKAYTQTVTRDVENIVNSATTLYPSSINTTSGGKVTADFNFQERNKLTLGAETWYRKSETIRYKVVTSSSDTTITVEQPTPKATMLDAGVFAYFKHIIIPSRLNVHAGLRFDFLKTENDTSFVEINKFKLHNGLNTALPRNSSVLFLPSIRPELAYSAHVDLEYLPVGLQKILFSMATSYRAASIEERYKYINQAGGIVHKGNPDLRPEKGYFSNLSYSIGSNKLALKADIFANYLFDLITEKQISSAVYQNTNISEAFFTGAEAELRYILRNSIELKTNISYVRGRDVLADTYLPQIPPLHGFTTITYHVARLFDTSVSAEWAAKQMEAATTELKTEGHVIFNWDLQAEPIKFDKQVAVKISGGVENLLNTAYYNHLSTSRGVIKLEPGRNIYVKANLSW